MGTDSSFKDFTYDDLDQKALDQYALKLRPVNRALVDEYCEVFAGPVFAAAWPVVVYETERGTYLTDGFHRMAAFRQWRVQGIGSYDAPRAIRAEVRQGSYADAVAHSATANATTGQKLSRLERWAAILRLHRAGWSYRRIMPAVGMSQGGVQYVLELDRDTPRPAPAARPSRKGLVFASQDQLNELMDDTSSDDYKRALELDRGGTPKQQAGIAKQKAERAVDSLPSLLRAVAAGDPDLVTRILVERDLATGQPLDARYAEHLHDVVGVLRAVADRLDGIAAHARSRLASNSEL